MMILGGVITVLGVAAVVASFIFLSAITGGVVGLVVACIGIASILSGIALFATGFYKNNQSIMSCEKLESLAV